MTAEEEVAQLKKELAAERASYANLYFASGVALFLGILFAIIGSGLSSILPLQPLTPLWLVVTLTRNFGALLLLLGLMGLPGIFARQKPRARWLGFAGFILTFIGGFLYTSYFFVTSLLFLPWIAQVAPNVAAACSVMRGCSFANGPQAFSIFFIVAGILFALGGILLGIAIMSGSILPHGSGLLLLLGLILAPVLFIPLNEIISFLNNIISFIVDKLVSGLPYLVFALLALALGWIGYTLVKRSGEPFQSPPASP
jgi:hypothetical protein